MIFNSVQDVRGYIADQFQSLESLGYTLTYTELVDIATERFITFLKGNGFTWGSHFEQFDNDESPYDLICDYEVKE